jgi:hypothetical protein
VERTVLGKKEKQAGVVQSHKTDRKKGQRSAGKKERRNLVGIKWNTHTTVKLFL